MRTIAKGATSQTLYIEVLDSTSSTGGRKTGLAYNTSSLTAYYVRNGGSATAITLATLAAANSAWSSGGFKEVDGTNMPGVYRLDVPDAAFASGAESVVITLKGATGMVQVSTEAMLTDGGIGADNLLDRTAGVETGYTPRQAFRIMLSALAGKSSGHPGSPVYRDVGDTKNRISATTSSGNRTAVTLDAT